MRKVLLLFFIFIFLENPSFSEEKKLVVYFDERYPTSWVSLSFAKEFKDFAEIFGFEVLSADELKIFLEEKVKSGAEETLVVFAQDVIPDTVVGSSPKSKSLLRKYLNSGGNVLWIGDVPFYFVGHKNGNKTTWDYLGARGILGFDAVGNWKSKNICEITELGKDLKLKTNWESRRAVKREDVDEILASDREGNISGWIKKYSPKGKGFIRILDTSLNNFSSSLGEDFYKIFSFVIPELKFKKIYCRIIPVPYSDYKIPLKFKEKNLEREVKIIIFDNREESKNYVLKVLKDKKIISEIKISSGNISYFSEIVNVPVFSQFQKLELYEKKEKIAESYLKEKEFCFDFSISIYPELNPVDIGVVLIPANKIVITEKQNLILDCKIGYLGEKEKELYCSISIDTKISERNIKVNNQKIENIYFNLGNLKIGNYPLSFEVKSKEEKLYSIKKELIVVKDVKPQKEFGAYYADLKYVGDVHIYDREKDTWRKENWDSLWRKGPASDIVVNFPDGRKFIFWRGSGYIPFWVSSKNLGLTYEWLEASSWGRKGTYFDCIEPLQDKECRYSRAEILYNTPARVVIRWRYALIDLDYKICDDEWAEEYYYLYPDGFGTRKLSGYIVPDTWHENNEFIILIPAGISPFKILPEKIIKILSLNGEKKEVSYPQPSVSWEKDTPAIFRINWHRDEEWTPILATKRFSHFICIYDGWRENGVYISPAYWGIHWPVTRGYPTTRTSPPDWQERAGHISLMAVEHFPEKREKISEEKEEVVWVYFIGNFKGDDKELVKIAKSWLSPAKIEVSEGGTYKGYDYFERGYIILKDENNYLKIKAKEELLNPVFIIEDSCLNNLKIYLNGELLKENYFVGIEKSFHKNKTVVFIEKSIPENTEILIEKG
jgi:hypothetical protein